MTDRAKDIVAAFNKKLKRDVTKLGHDPERIPTGVFALDLAMGGGIPLNRMSMFYGPEGSLKSLLAQLVVAQAQRKYPKHVPVYIDVEGTLTEERAETLGVDLSRWVPLSPDSAEEAISMADKFIRATDVSVVIVDSLAAMLTQRESSMDDDKDNVGGNSIAIGRLYRKTAQGLGEARREGRPATLLCINQIRNKIGGYGNPESVPGGNAIKFGSSMSVRVYAKDLVDKDISKDLPAFKEANAIIKKEKVPIVNKNAQFMIALLDNDKFNLKVGQAYDVNTILSYLKGYDLLVSGDKGFDLTWADTGEVEHFRVQKTLKEKIISDAEFAARIKAMIVSVVMKDTHG